MEGTTPEIRASTTGQSKSSNYSRCGGSYKKPQKQFNSNSNQSPRRQGKEGGTPKGPAIRMPGGHVFFWKKKIVFTFGEIKNFVFLFGKKKNFVFHFGEKKN